MKDDVKTKWHVAVKNRPDGLSIAHSFDTEDEAIAESRRLGGARIWRETVDHRNWERVDAEHPLTEADIGRTVRMRDGGERVVEGVRDDWLVDIKCSAGIYRQSLSIAGYITHVHRPRMDITWREVRAKNRLELHGYLGAVCVAKIIGTILGSVAKVMLESGGLSHYFESVDSAKDWCHKVVARQST